MRTFSLALLSVALLALGCRVNSSQVLLERDLRLQEDKIWELEGMLNNSDAAREATLRENEALKKELAGGDRGPGDRGPSDRAPGGRGPASDYRAPSVELPSDDSSPPSRSRGREAPKLEAPTIELPGASDSSPVDMSPGVEINPGRGGASMGRGKPTKLVINKRLTGGLDRDGRNGDEGVLVVVEPRDAAGNLVQTPGTISVVVMDPALEGPEARIARWDFAPDELPSHFHNTVFGQGLQFELLWPGEAPRNRDLQVYVRFTTEDGVKLTTDTKIDVRTPADPPRVDRQTKNWSPNESATRPQRNKTPNSRLKSRPDSADQGDYSPDDEDDQHADPARRSRGPIQQASRPDRPMWKPYR